MTLDDGSPSFLTLTQDETQDPIYEPYLLTYDESLATETDIKEHTINYTVSVPVYNGIIADLHGSFTFEILPPDEDSSPTILHSDFTDEDSSPTVLPSD